ncbi:MAG: site-specific DNA-methyltransferase [bacterium]
MGIIMDGNKIRAGRNKTTFLTDNEKLLYSKKLDMLTGKVDVKDITNKTINQNLFEVLDYFPDRFVDLLFIDPPYNISKVFNTNAFVKIDNNAYKDYIDSWLLRMIRMLKPTASIYICGDWKSTSAIYEMMSKYFIVRNRINWEREKGRGANANWKNCTEDIWFGTVSNNYYFNAEAVKMKRKVLAPYTDSKGLPKDWEKTAEGNFRITFPSNFWTDITVPYWSMPENTDHPAQKPEKLLAKIILASSKKGDFVFDPFLGSGTTSVVAKKLERCYCGVELDKTYACLSEKRLNSVQDNSEIQGYYDGVFWERNTLNKQSKSSQNGSKIKTKADKKGLSFV